MRTRALRQFNAPGGAGWDIRDQLDQCSCDHLEGQPRQAYNEEAFRYFLEIERRRSELSSRPFLLLLVDLKKRRGASSQIPQAAAERLFRQLSRCLRDTDFVGWYREERVAGAVLTQRPDMPQTNATRQVAERVRQALAETFELDVSRRFQVRVYQIPAMPEPDLPARENQS